MKVKIAGKIKTSTVNGEGIRYTIFFQGCDLSPKCEGCHSPHTWDISKGITTTTDELVADIKKVKKYLDGVAISGGNPTMQYDELIDLCTKIKQLELDIWLWSGYKFEYLKEHYPKVLDIVDTIIDGRYDCTKSTKKQYRGSDNQVMWIKKDGIWRRENEDSI